jgi:hypothetical protein
MSVAEIISANMEPLEPQTAIVAFLLDNNGKRIDKRLITRLNEAVPGWHIRMHQIAGMTNLEWAGYGNRGSYRDKDNNIRTDERDGGSMLVAYALKNLTVDLHFIQRHNVAYFGAAMERNKKREAALADTEGIARLEATIQTFLLAREALRKAFEYGGPFATDASSIESAYDLNLDSR